MFLIRIIFHLLRKWNISWEMTGLDQRQASRRMVGHGFLRQRLLRSRDPDARLSDPQGSAKFPERPLWNLESTARLTPGPAAGDLGRVT